MKNHFITGVTGYVGRNLTKALLMRGDKVFALVRPSGKNLADGYLESIFEKDKNLILLWGDITEKNLGLSAKDLRKLEREKIQHFWHLAANLSFRRQVKYRQKFKANVEGTRNAVNLANKLGAIFCYFSSAFVGADCEVFSEFDGDISQKFNNDWEKTKFLGEQVVTGESKFSYIIFRPSFIIENPIEAKAKNCTFSYYRYIYMFFLLRQIIVKYLRLGGFSKAFLVFLGISEEKGRIRFARLILPYPRGAKVNFVPMSYVIKNALKISDNKAAYNKIYHLTHPRPRTLIFYMKIIFDELSVSGIRFVAINPQLFRAFFYVLHFLAVPWRGYIESARLYLPYISTTTRYVRKNVNLYNNPPKYISRKFFSKVNRQAFRGLFPQIKIND